MPIQMEIVQPHDGATKAEGVAFNVRVDQVPGDPEHGYAFIQVQETPTGDWILAAFLGIGGRDAESNLVPWSSQWSTFSVQTRIFDDCSVRVGVWPTEDVTDGDPTLGLTEPIFLNELDVVPEE